MSNVRRHRRSACSLPEESGVVSAKQTPRSEIRRKEEYPAHYWAARSEPHEKLMQGGICRNLHSQNHGASKDCTPSPFRPPVPQAGGRLTRVAACENKPTTKGSIAQAPVREAHCSPKRRSQCKPQESPAFVVVQRVTPNPSIERTSTGRPHLALISFWAKRVPPVPAAHVKR